MTKKQILLTLGACLTIEALIIASALYLLERPIPKQTVCTICARNKALNDYCSSCFDMDDFGEIFLEVDPPTHTASL